MIFSTKEFRKDLAIKRIVELNISLDEASKEIGISKATLSRLENAKPPDVETFAKCCVWLKVDPNKYFKQ